MNKKLALLLSFILIIVLNTNAQSDSIVLHDINWDKSSPASMTELTIPSQGSRLAGFIYSDNGAGKHPTLLLLHGFPGNERNLDLAQVVRAHGWNVIYFDYRGSWGSEGKFSFENCVQDVKNVVAFCKKYSDSLKIDTTNIVLFGHSMGGFVCLKALAEIPEIKKGFALSTWNIYNDAKNMTPAQLSALEKNPNNEFGYFVLNTNVEKLFTPVINNLPEYNLQNFVKELSDKQIIMLDEHPGNASLANEIKKENHNYFDYEVWQTDHPFTNKRISLMNKVLAFLDKQ